MTNNSDLAAALSKETGSTRRRTAAAPEKGSRKTRTTVPLTLHYPEEVRSQIKILAAEQKTTIENLVSEGLNDLFAKYGKPEIAPRKIR